MSCKDTSIIEVELQIGVAQDEFFFYFLELGWLEK
jgi:hypothetical protein